MSDECNHTIGIYYCEISGQAELVSERGKKRFERDIKYYDSFDGFKYCPDCGEEIGYNYEL